ncbi:MAG: hypothetical protein J3K34DRAFT_520149 [Monoraphidium minutum]|nr:MAG: hypothetical protein J3K34DRAFT_520149 [Monoraphidium minutum]
MLDLLLVGAGPHNLCLLLRLLEPAGAAVDAVRRPPSSKRDVEQRAHKQAWLEAHVAVVDERGAWMDRWCSQFNSLRIPFLRSNSGLHVDPHDSYSLTHFAEATGRSREVQALRRIGKSEAFHGPFHTPGSALFEDHCADCVRRYCVDNVVQKGRVAHVEPVFGADGRVSHTRVTLEDGRALEARRVVLGIGSTNLKRLPPFASEAAAAAPAGRVMHAWDLVEAASSAAAAAASDAPKAAGAAARLARRAGGGSGSSSEGADEPGSSEEWGSRGDATGAAVASSQSESGDEDAQGGSPRGGGAVGGGTGGAPTPLEAAGLVGQGEHVIIVGGGLTSAHLAQLAVAGGAGRVTLLMRGPLRIKQFDVDVEFMGRLRGEALAGYRRRRGGEARLAALRRALQGGSMTPEAWAGLERLRTAGVLAVHEHVEVGGAEWDASACALAVWSEDGGLELSADRLWLATGSLVDAGREPALRGLMSALPVPLHGGLPALQPDLEWAPGAGVYVLGAYAALQLGPGALNLAGAKTGTALVVDAIRAKGGCGGAKGATRAARRGGGDAAGRGGGEGEGEEGWLSSLRALQRRYLMPAGGAPAAQA